MLKLVIPKTELFDESKEEFIYIDKTELLLEHSLISISKWESKWKKPFIDNKERTREESIDYIRCMTINSNVDDMTYNALTQKALDEVNRYIDDPMTATWFPNRPGGGNGEVVTAEIIYYWMLVHGIPFECQKWHLNKLLTLVRVCNAKNGGNKKMGVQNTMAQNRALNEARRAKARSKG